MDKYYNTDVHELFPKIVVFSKMKFVADSVKEVGFYSHGRQSSPHMTHLSLYRAEVAVAAFSGVRNLTQVRLDCCYYYPLGTALFKRLGLPALQTRQFCTQGWSIPEGLFSLVSWHTILRELEIDMSFWDLRTFTARYMESSAYELPHSLQLSPRTRKYGLSQLVISFYSEIRPRPQLHHLGFCKDVRPQCIGRSDLVSLSSLGFDLRYSEITCAILEASVESRNQPSLIDPFFGLLRTEKLGTRCYCHWPNRDGGIIKKDE
jgi:hypothetical protein